MRWDLSDDKDKRGNAPKGLHLTALVKAINDCGIPFKVWEKLDNNGKKTSRYDWRSLVGQEKKKLLECLPEKFPQVLKPEICVIVTKIWQVPGKVCVVVCTSNFNNFFIKNKIIIFEPDYML